MIQIDLKQHAIVIHDEALSVLDSFTQRKSDQSESGGIILGKIVGEVIHVLKLSIPTELDKASRANFERHRLSAQIIINYEFYNSNHQITYLGEWHTHPEKYPSPSGIDRKMIKEQYLQNKFHTNFLLLLIKGVKELYVGVYETEKLIHLNVKL